MLWELAGLKEQAPEAEKGFSMLTAALKKKIASHRKAEIKRKDNETPRPRRGSRGTKRLAEKTRTRKSASRKRTAKKKRG
jgi:hypothetical protein